jgi:hypothetical protein
VETVFNDPKGLLGLNPATPIVQYEVPKEFSKNEFLKQHLDFLGNFGEWNNDRDVISAYNLRRRFKSNEELLNTGLTVYPKSEQFRFWLENRPFVDGAVANIRRAVWSVLQVRAATGVTMNSTIKISGINGVGVDRIPFTAEGIEFLKALDSVQNNPVFDRPLSDLTPEEFNFIKNWLFGRLDQSDLTQRKIALEEIIQEPPH